MSSSSQVPGDMQHWENVRKLAGQGGVADPDSALVQGAVGRASAF